MPAKNVAISQKAPPTESAAALITRNWVVASFWAVVLFFGFPIWLWTTSIHRANLPITDMLEWAEGRACTPVFPLRISLEAPSLADNEVQELMLATQHALDDLNEFTLHTIRLTQGQSSTQEPPALTVNLVADKADEPRSQLRPHTTTLDVFYNPSMLATGSSSSSLLVKMLATTLRDIFLEEQVSIAYMLNSNSEPSSALREQASGLSKVLTPDLTSRLDRQQNRAIKYSPTYHITISLFTPSSVPSSWDIETAVQEFLTPLLTSLNTSTFTVDTQIQLFSSFAKSFRGPEFDEGRRVWTLSQESLSGFVNAAEWPLIPSMGEGLTLNFVLYVPSAENSPLVVKESLARSWTIPQWGGIYILNPSAALGTVPKIPSRLTVDEIKPALLTFSRQLLALLGAPESPIASLDLQIQSLIRYRAASLLLSASSTLGSMARLTSKLSQIPIPENVAYAVDRTLEDLKESCELMKSGEFNLALGRARSAYSLAEEAFFEKSMVGQVYFPDEHKVAVYLPLLAPISVPLLSSGLKLLKGLKDIFRSGAQR